MQTPRRNRRRDNFKYKGLYIFTSILAIIIVVLCINLISIKKEIESIPIAEQNNEPKNEISSTPENPFVEVPEEEEPIPTVEGQKLINNAVGYNMEFTTSNENPKTYKEYKQFLGPWADKSYNGKNMSYTGSDITSLAILASGYGLDTTPETLRTKYLPNLTEEDFISAFEKLGITCNNFTFSISEINKKSITEWLSSGRPVIIEVNSSRENMWTNSSQYMILLDVNQEGKFYVSNPNGEDLSETASGWYSASQIIPFVVKAAFIEDF